jgi:hypothetical protein
MIRNAIKDYLSTINHQFLERVLALSIVKNNFPEVRHVPHFVKREELWDLACDRIGNRPLTYLEFGVWEGYSIKYFAEKVGDSRARFFGFDSFEGLPEDWGAFQKGSYTNHGRIPETDDARIKFVKGWFQETLPDFFAQTSLDDPEGALIVHYDADLYSSTLYCLSLVDALKTPYLAIFDEFTGHETRALQNYHQAFGAKIEFLGRTGGIKSNWPDQVLALITPGAHA